MNKKYIKALSITIILTIGMLGAVSGFSETDSTKTNIESKKCDHKDAEKCKKHDSEKCDKANKAGHKSGSCCKAKAAGSKACEKMSEKKSEKKCTRSAEDSTKTI
jgi:hypothetical protein